MKIYYTLELKERGVWVVFKNIEKEFSFNFSGVFKGTKKECQEWMEERTLKGVNI